MSLESITIADAATGTQAKILPGIGFNCYSFSVHMPEGPLETLWAAPEFADGKAKPSGSGIPLLFPFAGRIGGTSFEFQGRTYELEAGDGRGNAIHGFVINRPWRVVEHAADRVVGQFQASLDDRSILPRWPADFRFTVEYRIDGTTLLNELTIENPDDKPLPFGLGTHAYFRVPLGGTNAEACRAMVPVSTNWELADLLPTGRAEASRLAEQLARGMSLQDLKLDNVFGGLSFAAGRAEATIHDPQSGRTLVQSFDEQFAACVVFNPPHRQALCMEPYTTIPDAFRLQASGCDPHLRVLAPGESFRTRIEIRVE